MTTTIYKISLVINDNGVKYFNGYMTVNNVSHNILNIYEGDSFNENILKLNTILARLIYI